MNDLKPFVHGEEDTHGIVNKVGIYKRKTAIERFWNKVKKTKNCWWWTGTRLKKGYGQFRIGKKKMQAHRYSWELHKGKIPKDMFVCHTCDNHYCVNPKHLWLGSHSDNMKDMINKGRGVDNRGENNGQSKLTKKQIVKIRRLYDTGKYLHRELAKRFLVSKSNIGLIIRKQRWKI